MGRTTCGAARHRKKVRILKDARGFRGGRGRYRLAIELLVRARVSAFRDRRRRKREFRALWITRLTAACRLRGINYSRLIFGLNSADIMINRKMLSELAIHAPEDFDAIVELAKKHSPRDAAAA